MMTPGPSEIIGAAGNFSRAAVVELIAADSTIMPALDIGRTAVIA
jgi:hypothetical protein